MLFESWFKKRRGRGTGAPPTAEEVDQNPEDRLDTVALDVLEQRTLELAQAHQELEQERRRYQELFNLAPQAYLETDQHGLLREINQATANLFLTRNDILIGVSLITLINKTDRNKFYNLLSELKYDETNEVRDYELKMRRPDGFVFNAAISVWAVRDQAGNVLSLRWILTDASTRKRIDTALKAAHESLLHQMKQQAAELAVVKATMTEQWEVRQQVEQQAIIDSINLAKLQTTHNALSQTVEEQTAELAEAHASLADYMTQLQRVEREGRERLQELPKQLLEIQEKERQRISQELHDEAGQALLALKFSLELIVADLSPEGINAAEAQLLRQQVNEVVQLCEETMARIRRLAHDLRPAALDDLGLNATLEGLCHDFAEWSDLQVEYEGVEIASLPGAIDIGLYRFLQEALTNTIKLAGAKHVWVKLAHNQKDISLSVQDDGRGFSDSACNYSGVSCGMRTDPLKSEPNASQTLNPCLRMVEM